MCYTYTVQCTLMKGDQITLKSRTSWSLSTLLKPVSTPSANKFLNAWEQNFCAGVQIDTAVLSWIGQWEAHTASTPALTPSRETVWLAVRNSTLQCRFQQQHKNFALRCPLGENISARVANLHLKCKWVPMDRVVDWGRQQGGIQQLKRRRRRTGD